MSPALAGSIVPVVTPFTGDGAVDYDTFAALVDWQARSGSDGVVVTGTSGEPNVLTLEERERLVKVAVEAATGRISVVAATGSQSLADTLVLTRAAQAAGADAALVVTPYYIKPPQAGLVEYFAEVAANTDLPVLIYHIPGRSGITMGTASVARLCERSANVVGMKHASPDLAYVSELLDRLGMGFRLFAGLEELGYPLLALGAAGVMNAVGNIAPRQVAEMCVAVLGAGDLVRGRDLHYKLLELNRAIFWETNPIPIKYLMVRLGVLPGNAHRLPMLAADAQLSARLDDLLRRNDWLREAGAEPAGAVAPVAS